MLMFLINIVNGIHIGKLWDKVVNGMNMCCHQMDVYQ